MESATSFERISDLSTEHVQNAVSSRAAFRGFLEHAASVAKPEDGGPKVLMAIAALADAAWVDGALRVELEGDDAATRVGLLVDAGFRERLFPVVTLMVPFDEFVRAVRLAPQLTKPLVVVDSGASNIVLTNRQHSELPLRDDVHTKPTVVRMAAVRPEALKNGGRGDDEG